VQPDLTIDKCHISLDIRPFSLTDKDITDRNRALSFLERSPALSGPLLSFLIVRLLTPIKRPLSVSPTSSQQMSPPTQGIAYFSGTVDNGTPPSLCTTQQGQQASISGPSGAPQPSPQPPESEPLPTWPAFLLASPVFLAYNMLAAIKNSIFYEFSAFYETQRFITVFRVDRHLMLS
jgi:hypothetical protein